MQIAITELRRGAVDEVDWSDLFDAKQTGPAAWVVGQPNVLDIPFSRDLTAAEVAMVQRRLESEDADEEAQIANIDAFLAQGTAASSKALAQALLAVVKIQRRGRPVSSQLPGNSAAHRD